MAICKSSPAAGHVEKKLSTKTSKDKKRRKKLCSNSWTLMARTAQHGRAEVIA
jgi:hypothetical protein